MIYLAIVLVTLGGAAIALWQNRNTVREIVADVVEPNYDDTK